MNNKKYPFIFITREYFIYRTSILVKFVDINNYNLTSQIIKVISMTTFKYKYSRFKFLFIQSQKYSKCLRKTISQINSEELYQIKYDSTYTKTNLRFYNAKDIPHFNEKTPDGVFNAEYDCALDTSPTISAQEMISWLTEVQYV